MLGKRSRPAIGKLAGALRSSIMDSMTSPRSPLECKMQSPRGLKMYNQGGIGLGLAVALDKPTNGGGEVLAKYPICGQFPTRSSPIPVSPSAQKDIKGCKVRMEMELEGLDEEFTYVTCHGPNKSTTRVYYDGSEFGKITQNSGDLKISPARTTSDSEPDFLSSCHLCRKTLHGKDIYMYRGEKAFCSTECRQKQIGMDERKEQCRSEVGRSSDLSSSPCTYSGRGQIFFSAGIVAV